MRRELRERAFVVVLLLFLCAPLWAQDWKVEEPEFPVEGQPGERVLVRLTGPAGDTSAYLKVAGTSSTETLVETAPGTYQAEVCLPASGTRALTLMDSGKPQNLGTLCSDYRPQWLLAPKELVTRMGPHPDYDRLTPLYAHQKVAVEARRGHWYRLRASKDWVDGTDLPPAALSEGPVFPNRLRRVRVEQDDNGDALLRLEMDRPAEVQVAAHGKTLAFTMYDTYQTAFDIRRPSEVATFLGPLLLQPAAQPRSTTLETTVPQLCGYQLEPEADGKRLTVRIRKPHGQLLKGLKITVDAGHGGPKDRGTVGHGGLEEKVLNLRVATALAEKLKALGAEVTMTRITDCDVASQEKTDASELQARIDRSIKAGSQLFISVHHNARPKVEDGMVSHGTDVYWYQPQSEALARALCNPVADAVGEPTRSFRWRSFYVIRQTHAPAVLIEFDYLSNPKLERDVLSQADYPAKAAQGVVDGLLKYLADSSSE